MRLWGLINFASMALSLARLHSCPLQFWFKENYKTSADVFKGLKSEPQESQALLCWHTFKATAKSNMQILNTGGSDNKYIHGCLWRPHEQPVIQRQVACREGQKHPHQYPGNENSEDGLSAVHGRDGWNTISFQIDKTTAVVYLLSVEGGRYSLARP